MTGRWRRLITTVQAWLAWMMRQLAGRRQLALHRAFGGTTPKRQRHVDATGTPDPDRRLRDATETVNHRATGRDLLHRELAALDAADAERLRRLAAALMEQWTQPDVRRELVRRRRTLDVRRTLRTNLPRYGGRVLTFSYRQPHIWLPSAERPARLLLIGDVSYSMTGYVGVALFFFHCLHRYFNLDAWIFSSSVTHATPWLDPARPFAEQMQRLAAAAGSWGQGTRLGHALEHIIGRATVSKDTHVVIMTDGDVMLHDGELDRLNLWLPQFAARSAGVTVLTPNRELVTRGREYTDLLDRVHTIPVHQMHAWNPKWQLRAARYGSLARHVNKLALAQNVGDLCAFCAGVATQNPPPHPLSGQAIGTAPPP